jgi:hypothetical protein
LLELSGLLGVLLCLVAAGDWLASGLLGRVPTGFGPDAATWLLAVAATAMALWHLQDPARVVAPATRRAAGLLLGAGWLAFALWTWGLQAERVANQGVVPSGRHGLDARLAWATWRVQQEVQGRVVARLPDRNVPDSVPPRLARSEGAVVSEVWRTRGSVPFERVSAQRLGGLVERVQFASARHFAGWALALLGVNLLLLGAASRWARRSLVLASLATTTVLSSLLSLRLALYWDEFYINLRHAAMLCQHGVFSINPDSRIEGTVDTLPLVATAVLHLAGLRLEDAFILTSLAGNALVVAASYLLARAMTGDRTWALATACGMGLLPSVAWVGATGFTAGLFTGWMLLGAYLLVFTERRGYGLLVLGTLTLVRTEGVLFSGLLVAWACGMRGLVSAWRDGHLVAHFRQLAGALTLVTAPFLLASAVRWWLYPSVLPTPIVLKNTGLDRGYALQGLQSLSEAMEGRDTHLLLFALVVFAAVLALQGARSQARDLLGVPVVAAAFILPYHIGGGDWLTPQWNRYGLPLEICATLGVLVAARLTLSRLGPPIARTVAFVLLASTVLTAVGDAWARGQATHIVTQTLGQLRHQEGDLVFHDDRIDALANLGRLLDAVLPPEAVVSSSEEATIMYFSGRRMLGLLGVSNPEVAREPLQPLGWGATAYKRRAVRSFERHRPDAFLAWEPFVRRLPGDETAGLEEALVRRFFCQPMIDALYYRVGSPRTLVLLGYENHTVLFRDMAFNIHVHRRVAPRFRANLARLGFTHAGRLSVPYRVSTKLSRRLVPAGPATLPQL